MAFHNHDHFNLVRQLLGIGAVNKTGINLAAGHIVQHLTHAVAHDKLGLHGFPQFGGVQRVLGVAPGRHGIGIANGNALEGLDIFKLGGLFGASGHDKHQVVERKILARSGVDNLGGHGLVHGALIGRGKNIYRRAFLNLFEQRIGGGVIGVHLQAGVLLFKHALDFVKGIGKAGSGRNGHFRSLNGKAEQGHATQRQSYAAKGPTSVCSLFHEIPPCARSAVYTPTVQNP